MKNAINWFEIAVTNYDRAKKFYSEVTLINQTFVMSADGDSVGKFASDNGAEVVGFVRLEVGEGIEKIEEDFAAEVAKTMGG